MVKDSRGFINAWPQIDCSITVTFALLKINSVASGSINSSSLATTSSFSLTRAYGTVVPVTASLASGSNLLGWTKHGVNVKNNPFITTSSMYDHTFDVNTTIYAAIEKPNITVMDFCYYTGSTLPDAICATCNTTASVFFNNAQYSGSGMLSSTWYQDSTFTQTVLNGYYKQQTASGSTPNTNIYSLISGSVSGSAPYAICDGSLIYCF
jgi:hypothetical protein